MRSLFLAAAIAAHLFAPALAGNYSESVDGDLSSLPASPTLWTLSTGANSLTGSAGIQPGGFDPDIVSFTIPENSQLDGIKFDNLRDDSAAFFGLQAGTPWNDGVGGAMTGANLLGWSLIGYGTFPNDLLVELR